MTRIAQHLRSNVVAYVALFVALGGTSYAALRLPPGSVGTRQLRDHSITPIKLDPKKTGAYIRAWAIIQNGRTVIASRPKAKVLGWDAFFAAGDVSWNPGISGSCFPLASGGDDFVQTAIQDGPHKSHVAHINVFTANGAPDPNPPITYVAIMCAAP
jgi:hypothetical protein